MATNYPTSLDNGTTLPNPTGTNTQNSPDHAAQHANANDAVKAVEAKVGIGSSTPTANTILFGTGTGTSAWTALTSAQLAATLSDETGTGSAVFATTPTLVTPKVDTINESTLNNGVTVGGVNLKSATITTASAVTTASIAANAITTAKLATGSSFTPATAAQTPYKFSVYRSAALTSSNTPTAVAHDTKVFDTGTNIDVVTNKGRFTAPIAGFYFFSAAAGNSVAGATPILSYLYKNGSRILSGSGAVSSASNGTHASVSGLLQLSATDYVEHYFIGGSGSTMDVGQAECYYHGFLLSAT